MYVSTREHSDRIPRSNRLFRLIAFSRGHEFHHLDLVYRENLGILLIVSLSMCLNVTHTFIDVRTEHDIGDGPIVPYTW
jgi:hypothetical protein